LARTGSGRPTRVRDQVRRGPSRSGELLGNPVILVRRMNLEVLADTSKACLGARPISTLVLGGACLCSAGSGGSELPDHTEEQRSVGRVVDDRQRERTVDDCRDPERGRDRSAGGRRGRCSMLVHLEIGLLYNP
jgi:hypothetical protein